LTRAGKQLQEVQEVAKARKAPEVDRERAACASFVALDQAGYAGGRELVLVAQELTEVCERRAGHGELPVEHGREPIFVHRDVGRTKVAVDQRRRTIELGQSSCMAPDERVERLGAA